MVSGLHHDVKYGKTRDLPLPPPPPPPPPSQTNNNSIVERIGTLEQKVEELQKQVKMRGGKTHRKRSRKSKKSRRRR